MDKKKKEKKEDGKKADKKATIAPAPEPSKAERNLIIMDGSTYHECVLMYY